MILKGKKILIMGVRNKWSIAWGVAQSAIENGAEKSVEGYNVMGVAKAALETSIKYLAKDLGKSGIRINAISVGPVKTLSAKGIKDFGNILELVEKKAPLHKNITIKDVGDTASFLFSDMSKAITAEVIHVDSGFSSVGV